MNIVSADAVRARIARLILGADEVSGELGTVLLHPHQREGAARVGRLLDLHGGALLADDVGLGKTYIALAVARGYSSTLVIAPAALREGWMSASASAAVAVTFRSVESLSRGLPRGLHPALVIVDEAHHLRTSNTRRYANARALCQRSRALLVTATPIHNRLGDLRSVLTLFLGERAQALTPTELARFVVRRAGATLTAPVALPRIRPAQWLDSVDDVDCLERIVDLAPAVAPADGGDGGALVTYGLVRQWASSRAALRAALKRRLSRALAIEDSLLAGRLPTRAELAAWCFVDGMQQMSFPELVTDHLTPPLVLLDAVQRHGDSIRDLLAWLEHSADPDVIRAAQLGRILADHENERIVVFSEYAETVSAMYRALVSRGGVVMQTHAGGRLVTGPISRAELLRRFARSNAELSAKDRIDCLLTTDVLSEGVNLQTASVVVHLDLPWNPARLEQRVGRLRRIGAARDSIGVYFLAPPAPSERFLEVERRLRTKLATAAQAFGVAGSILPGFRSPDGIPSANASVERLHSALQRWRREDIAVDTDLPVASAYSAVEGAVACVVQDGEYRLVAVSQNRIVDTPNVVAEFLTHAEGADVATGVEDAHRTLARVARWLRERDIADAVALPALHVAVARRHVLRRVARIERSSARHLRPRLAPLIRSARAAAMATFSQGAERVLDELAAAPLTDEAWLHALSEFTALNGRSTPHAESRVVALLLLQSEDE